MNLTIGVMGSSGGDLSETARRKAYELGEAIAEHGAILITGGCPGLPYEAIRGAKSSARRGGSSSFTASLGPPAPSHSGSPTSGAGP